MVIEFLSSAQTQFKFGGQADETSWKYDRQVRNKETQAFMVGLFFHFVFVALGFA